MIQISLTELLMIIMVIICVNVLTLLYGMFLGKYIDWDKKELWCKRKKENK